MCALVCVQTRSDMATNQVGVSSRPLIAQRELQPCLPWLHPTSDPSLLLNHTLQSFSPPLFFFFCSCCFLPACLLGACCKLTDRTRSLTDRHTQTNKLRHTLSEHGPDIELDPRPEGLPGPAGCVCGEGGLCYIYFFVFVCLCHSGKLIQIYPCVICFGT